MARKCPVKGCNSDVAPKHTVCWNRLAQAIRGLPPSAPRPKDEEKKPKK